MNNKKGNSAVFLTVILAALMSITLALIYGVREASVKSRVDGVVNLAADSVMSEFNRDIQRDYGLFLIKGGDKELSKKLRRYVEYSLDAMGDVDIEKIKVSGDRFSTSDIGLIKDQILEYIKAVGAEDGFAAGDDTADGTVESDLPMRSLKHGPTVVSLPSAGLPDKSLTSLAESIADNVSNVENVFKSGTEGCMLNQYMFSHFNNRAGAVSDEHFFRSEIEYILSGKLTDEKNEKHVESALKALRFPLNLMYIYEDAGKRSEVLALAEILTPGAAAAATQAALAAAWAYAESDNDVELLCQGHKVPMLKDKGSWAIDLDSVAEGILGGTVVPSGEKGYDYGKYLQILMFFQDENIKISRIMDLIQINMRSAYDGGFLISEYAAGIDAEVKVNGRDYRYEKKY